MDLLDDVFYSPSGNFDGDVAEGAEFASIVTTESSNVPEPGQFYSYQLQLARASILEALEDTISGLLKDEPLKGKGVCIYRPGTGKTFTYIGLAELLRLHSIKDPFTDKTALTGNPYVDQYITTGKMSIKKIIIFTINEELMENVKNEIAQYYAAHNYPAYTIKDTYRVVTHRIFANEHRAMFDEKFTGPDRYANFEIRMKMDYSDTLFVFDESFNIAGEQLERVNMGILEDGGKYTGGDDPFKSDYNLIHFIVHSGTNVMRYAFTGTPMNNDVREHTTTFNLVHDRNMQVDPLTDFSSWTHERKEAYYDKYFTDIVYYIEEPKDAVNLVYDGDPVVGLAGKYVYCPILEGSIQEDVYLHYVETHVEARRRGEKVDAKTFENNKLCASNMVYDNDHEYALSRAPDVKKDKPEVYQQKVKRDEVFIKLIKDDEVLEEYGSKEYEFRLIVRNALDSKGNPAKKIGRFDFFVNENGTRAGILNLRAMGYEDVKPGQFRLDAAGRILYNGVPATKKKRYVVIGTTAWSKRQKDELLEVWASMANVIGEYIHVFLAAPALRIGYSIKETHICVIMTEPWNQAYNDQAIRRFLRAGGHVNSLKHFGVKEMDLEVYILVAYFERKDWTGIIMPTEGDPKVARTFGQWRIITAASKQPEMDETLNAMVKRSVAGRYNQRRNTDIKVKYAPLPDPDTLYYNTFFNLHIGYYVSVIEQFITGYMQTHVILDVNELVSITSAYRYPLRVYEQAIQNIIHKKTTVKNRYGMIKYICWDGNYVYLEDSYPGAVQDRFDAYYANYIPTIMVNLEDAPFELTAQVVEKVLSFGNNIEAMRQYLITKDAVPNRKGFYVPSGLLQKAILEEAMRKVYIYHNVAYQPILDLFSFYIYSVTINDEVVHYHTFHVDRNMDRKAYNVMTYVENPAFFYLLNVGDGSFLRLRTKSARYNILKKNADDELPKRFNVLFPFPQAARTPYMTNTMLDNMDRLARRPTEFTTERTLAEDADIKSGKRTAANKTKKYRGGKCSDSAWGDLVAALYEMKPDLRPQYFNPEAKYKWVPIRNILYHDLDILLAIYAKKDVTAPKTDKRTEFERYVAKHAAALEIKDAGDRDFVAAFLYAWLHYHDKHNPGTTFPSLIDKWINDELPPDHDYIDVSYEERTAANQVFKHDPKVPRSAINIELILTQVPENDEPDSERKAAWTKIRKEASYLEFMWNWREYLGNVTAGDLCEKIKILAKATHRFAEL